MKKNRIVIGIIVLLILLISGVFVGKIIYDRIVEQERASALAEEQRLEEEHKADYIKKLKFLDAYSESPNSEEGLWATKEINGIYVYEDYLKVWFRLCQLIWISEDPLTLEELYGHYLEPDPIVEKKVERLFRYREMEGVRNQTIYLE